LTLEESMEVVSFLKIDKFDFRREHGSSEKRQRHTMMTTVLRITMTGYPH